MPATLEHLHRLQAQRAARPLRVSRGVGLLAALAVSVAMWGAIGVGVWALIGQG